MSKINKAIVEAKDKGYYVDKDGNVYSPNKLLSLKTRYNRYIFSIRCGGERVNIPVHKFVAYLKYGNDIFGDDIVVRHLNDISLDNKWDNIAIGTQFDNMQDIPKEKRIKKAINASKKKRRFSDDEVKNILNDRKNGFTYKELCEKYDTSKGTLSYLFNNSYYASEV